MERLPCADQVVRWVVFLVWPAADEGRGSQVLVPFLFVGAMCSFSEEETSGRGKGGSDGL